MEGASFVMNTTLTATTNPPLLMDGRIWRNLPQPLFDRVLAFLPPPSFFRFRSVSKRLYSLLFSESFLDLHHLLSPHHSPSFLFFPITNPSTPFAFLFDPSLPSPTWHRLPLPLPGPITSSFSPSASSAGLLCFLSGSPGPKSLILLNPLTTLAAQLPASPRPRLLPSVGLAVADSSLSVVLAGDDMISPYAVKNLTSETFHADGATGFYSPWATLSPLPRLCSLEPAARMAFASGTFYCISCSPFSVLAYDLAANHWARIQPPMRRFLRSPSLLALGGRVLLAASVEKRKLSVPKSVRIWELQFGGGGSGGTGWAEVERMPLEVYRQFEEAEGGRGFECAGSGGGRGYGDYIAVTIRNSTNVIVFDFGRREWRWAPPCPFSFPAGGLRGFGYEPRLATPAVGLIDSAALAFQGFAG